MLGNQTSQKHLGECALNRPSAVITPVHSDVTFTAATRSRSMSLFLLPAVLDLFEHGSTSEETQNLRA